MIDWLCLPAVIRAVAPHADAAGLAAALKTPMERCGLVTPRRMAAFIGQAAVESMYFDVFEEVMKYRTATHIMETWDTRFPTIASAEPFVSRLDDPIDNPRARALANHVYANRLGNGDEASGDGWLCRGRGMIQITGRAAYVAFAAAMHMTLDQAIAHAATLDGAADSACWWWGTRGQMLALSDGPNGPDVPALTRRVNAASLGLRERIAATAAALAVFGPTTPPPEITADQLMDAELRTLGGSPPA